jgi:hypothetical protein
MKTFKIFGIIGCFLFICNCKKTDDQTYPCSYKINGQLINISDGNANTKSYDDFTMIYCGMTPQPANTVIIKFKGHNIGNFNAQKDQIMVEIINTDTIDHFTNTGYTYLCNNIPGSDFGVLDSIYRDFNLNITQYDTTKKIISGFFNGRLVNFTTEVGMVAITDGTFTVKMIDK